MWTMYFFWLNVFYIFILSMKQTMCRSTESNDNVKTEHFIANTTNVQQRQTYKALSEYSTNEYFNNPTAKMNYHRSNHQQSHKIIDNHNRNDSKSLKRVFLSNRTITCNDGSQAGFYLRKSIVKSKRWVVYLEGGWHCSNASTCKYRWNNHRNFMTSTQWSETRDVGGILSPYPSENPYLYDANHVFVPYCSSDSWSGTASQTNTQNIWKFMGSLIVRQVISDLLPLGLDRQKGGSELLLSGSSAGGVGVMINLDRIDKFLREEKKVNVMVRGICDSGWFLDRTPYFPSAVPGTEIIQQGWKLWEGTLPESCIKTYAAEPWRCYYAPHLYPTLKAPLFVFQWAFDDIQMQIDSLATPPSTPKQWNFVHEMGAAVRTSLENVKYVFIPSCVNHSVLTKREWTNIEIDKVSFPQALRCWEQATKRKNNNNFDGQAVRRKNRKMNNNKNNNNNRNQKNNNKNNNRNNNNNNNIHNNNKNNNNNNHHFMYKKNSRNFVTEDVRRNRRQQQRKYQKQYRLAIRQEEQDLMDEKLNSNLTNNKTNKNKIKKRKNNNNLNLNKQHSKMGKIQRKIQNNSNNKNRRRNKNNNNSNGNSKVAGTNNGKRFRIHKNEPKNCALRFMEKCSWPQCNLSCPAMKNVRTGEDIKTLDLLIAFGVNIDNVANALAIDKHTLSIMEPNDLITLLTEQAHIGELIKDT